MSRFAPLAFCGLALALVANPQPPAAGPLELTSPLGKKYYALPDDKGIVTTAEKNLAANPNNVDLLLKLAHAQASVWQYREAVDTCTRALKISPNNAATYLERGHRELALRDFQRALDDLNRAVSLDPKNTDEYYHLGLAHYFLAQFPQAADSFRHAVELAPNIDTRINATNWLYASERRAREDAKAAQTLARITPNTTSDEPHTRFYLSLLRFFQGKLRESDVVPPQPPKNSNDLEPELHFDTVAYGVGNWHLYNGDTAKAEDYFRRILNGRVWVTWGFVGAESDFIRLQRGNQLR